MASCVEGTVEHSRCVQPHVGGCNSSRMLVTHRILHLHVTVVQQPARALQTSSSPCLNRRRTATPRTPTPP